MTAPHVHATHPKVRNRLKRAAGHLNNVITMLDGERPCLEIVQQLQAVVSALDAAKKTLIHDHLDHCLGTAVPRRAPGGTRVLQEFKDIVKFL